MRDTENTVVNFDKLPVSQQNSLIQVKAHEALADLYHLYWMMASKKREGMIPSFPSVIAKAMMQYQEDEIPELWVIDGEFEEFFKKIIEDKIDLDKHRF